MKNVFNTLRKHTLSAFHLSLNVDIGREQQNSYHGMGTQRQFSENICSEDDLRCRIFGTLVVTFLGDKNMPVSTV